MDARPVIGVDVGKEAHYAVALDGAGKQLKRTSLPNRQREIDDLVAWAKDLAAVVVADQPHGAAALLIHACWEAEVQVGYLHGLAMARARDFYEGEAKTDPKDAFVIADVGRLHPGRVHWLSPGAEERAQLELLCGHDEDLRADVNRLVNRLRGLMATHWPGVEAVLGERLLNTSICELLTRYPDPGQFQRVGHARLVRFLQDRRARRPELLVDKILAAASEQHTVVAGSTTAARLVANLAQELRHQLNRRQALGKEIESCFFEQPQAEILISLPGMGPRLGARVLVEIGDITRFESPSKLAAYAGLGPTPRQSGSSINTSAPSRGGNHRLKNALFLAAFASLSHPPSRAYYDRKRAQNRDHNEAVRCLARRRVDVLHSMLVRGVPYTWTQPDPSAISGQAA